MGRGSQNMMYGKVSKQTDPNIISDEARFKLKTCKMVLPKLASESRIRVTDSVFINYPAIHNYNPDQIYSSKGDKMLFSQKSNHLWIAADISEDQWDNVQSVDNISSPQFSGIKERILSMNKEHKNLVPISFNLLKLSDADDLKLFFYPRNEPNLSQCEPLIQDNLLALVEQVNKSQTIINSGAVSAVERTIGGRIGEWYYDPEQSQGSFFQFYFITKRGNIVGSLESIKQLTK
jgi:hypothetical protein